MGQWYQQLLAIEAQLQCYCLLWISTNNIYETSVITIIFNVLSTIIYYFHEIMWGKIRWGNVEHSKLINQNNNFQ